MMGLEVRRPLRQHGRPDGRRRGGGREGTRRRARIGTGGERRLDGRESSVRFVAPSPFMAAAAASAGAPHELRRAMEAKRRSSASRRRRGELWPGGGAGRGGGGGGGWRGWRGCRGWRGWRRRGEDGRRREKTSRRLEVSVSVHRDLGSFMASKPAIACMAMRCMSARMLSSSGLVSFDRPLANAPGGVCTYAHEKVDGCRPTPNLLTPTLCLKLRRRGQWRPR